MLNPWTEQFFNFDNFDIVHYFKVCELFKKIIQFTKLWGKITRLKVCSSELPNIKKLQTFEIPLGKCIDDTH